MLQKCCVRKCNGIIMGLFGTNTHMQQSGPRQLYIKIIHFFTFCGHDMARGCALPARAKCDFYMEDLSANIGQKEQEESHWKWTVICIYLVYCVHLMPKTRICHAVYVFNIEHTSF